MRKLLLYPLILVAGIVVGLFLNGASVWMLVAGDPDLGRADFSRAERPSNEFVACSEGTGCERPDLVIGAHPAQPSSVIGIVEEAMRNAERVDDDSDGLHRRYVVRSTLLKFPDTISIEAIPAANGTALRISSRSQIGKSDFGVNGERVRNLARRLNVSVPG